MQIYTLLPGNYIIDLAAGARIELDPAVQEFVLFCSPEDAKKALKNAALPGDWRIYKVEGTLAEVCEGSGEYKLKCPALIEDWVDN